MDLRKIIRDAVIAFLVLEGVVVIGSGLLTFFG